MLSCDIYSQVQVRSYSICMVFLPVFQLHVPLSSVVVLQNQLTRFINVWVESVTSLKNQYFGTTCMFFVCLSRSKHGLIIDAFTSNLLTEKLSFILLQAVFSSCNSIVHSRLTISHW